MLDEAHVLLAAGGRTGRAHEALRLRAGEHDALEAERARLQEENFDLAGRLVTAQIRRLESEKILLESKIEWQRLEEKTAGEKGKPAPREEPPAKGPTEKQKP